MTLRTLLAESVGKNEQNQPLQLLRKSQNSISEDLNLQTLKEEALKIPLTLISNPIQRILLVDDSKVTQRVTELQLKAFGYVVDIAENGYQALQALKQNSYGLILMDCLMPEMDGYQATTEIRKNEAITGTHIPIIALTGHELATDRDKCLAIGMDSYLSKPIEIRALVQMLRHWFPSEKIKKMVAA